MVKPRTLAEVRETLNSERFRSWYDSVVKARLKAREAVLRHEEALTQVHLMEFRAELKQKNATDTLYRAAEYEDMAAAVQAEATELENKSLELVGEFERQRTMCSELWASMSAVEQNYDQHKDKATEARLKRLREEYERETAKKNRMWEDVEGMWNASLEKNLAVQELRIKSGRVRRESEALFADADASTRSARAIKQEAEQMAQGREAAEAAVKELLARARTTFDAIIHEDFLYWPQRETNKQVYVCPLISESGSYNLELKACSTYQASRQRGVEFLEPVVELARSTRVDTRLDDFFLKNRPSAQKGA